MASALETTILQHREALLRGDETALRVMINAYAPIRLRLIEQIEKLTAEILAGHFRPTDAYRLDRWKVLLDQTEAEMTRLAAFADPFIRQAQMQAIQTGILQSTALVAVQSPAAAASFVRLPTRAMQDVVGRLSDGSPLRSWLDGLGTETGNTIAGALKQAVARGTNPRAVASALAKQVDVAGQRLLLTTRSTVLDSYRSASLENYRNNEDIVAKWEWLCALQIRTCRVCLALDGQQFPLSEEFQKSHLACRCTSIPVLSGGPAIKRKRGSEWFAEQDAAVQDRTLGKQAGAAYRNGEVALSDFVTLRKDMVWGDRYQAASFAQARRSAGKKAAVRTPDTRYLLGINTPPGGSGRSGEDEAPSFTKAGSIQDAESFARSLGIQDVSYGDPTTMTEEDQAIAVRAANATNEALGIVKGKGLPLPAKVRVAYEPQNRGMIAYFNRDEMSITANTSTEFWRDNGERLAQFQDNNYLVAGTDTDLVLHELGHFLSAHKAVSNDEDMIIWTLDARLPIPTKFKPAARSISRYAETDRGEFVAEVFTQLIRERPVSDDVLALYRRFGGYEP